LGRTDLTVVYYTANREDPTFEARVRERLVLASDGLPIISVSQQPLDFGRNLCVGEQEPCMWNARRQMLMGATAAETEWVVFCEADTLYPPAYFAMPPAPVGWFTRYCPGAIVWTVVDQAWPKNVFETGIQIRRSQVIDLLTANLQGATRWGVKADWPGACFDAPLAEVYEGDWPIVSCKTGHGMHGRTHTGRQRLTTLTGWGDVRALKLALGLQGATRGR